MLTECFFDRSAPGRQYIRGQRSRNQLLLIRDTKRTKELLLSIEPALLAVLGILAADSRDRKGCIILLLPPGARVEKGSQRYISQMLLEDEKCYPNLLHVLQKKDGGQVGFGKMADGEEGP